MPPTCIQLNASASSRWPAAPRKPIRETTAANTTNTMAVAHATPSRPHVRCASVAPLATSQVCAGEQNSPAKEDDAVDVDDRRGGELPLHHRHEIGGHEAQHGPRRRTSSPSTHRTSAAKPSPRRPLLHPSCEPSRVPAISHASPARRSRRRLDLGQPFPCDAPLLRGFAHRYRRWSTELSEAPMNVELARRTHPPPAGQARRAAGRRRAPGQSAPTPSAPSPSSAASSTSPRTRTTRSSTASCACSPSGASAPRPRTSTSASGNTS